MGLFAVGEVVLVNFPNTDLTPSKIRPAVVLSDLPGRNCILCAITSKQPPNFLPFSELSDADFQQGALRAETSYVAYSKLFTADENMIRKSIGHLSSEYTCRLLESVRGLFRPAAD